MISTDHVRVRRRGGELTLTQLKPKDRDEMTLYAAHAIRILRGGLHKRREELESQFDDIIVPAYLTRVADGLKKMLFDRCTFGSSEQVDVLALRAKVFSLASSLRAELGPEEPFDRERVLIQASEELGVNIMHIEDDLFSDLKGAQRLKDFTAIDPQLLLSEYELAQEQAVLIRATELWVKVQCADASEYRYFFRQLKFRRLLCEIRPCPRPSDGYDIQISGPHSIFKSSTKYGLQLALLLPALRRCRRWRLCAQVQWGKEKTLLDFQLEGEREALPDQQAQDLPSEVLGLLTQLKKSKSPWSARRSTKVIHLPEHGGVCVPDLVFSHPEHKHKVYLEVLGYWSRDAVWRRVEWAESLKDRVIFAVSSRLRVSEEVLDDELPSALLVYKGAIVVSALVKLLDELATHSAGEEAEVGADAEHGEEHGEEHDEGEELEIDPDQSFSEDISVSEDSAELEESITHANSSEPGADAEGGAPSEGETEELIKASLSGVGLSEVEGKVSLEERPSQDQLSLFPSEGEG